MKTKTKISFVCQECGYDTPSWLGKCPECGAWNSMREITIPKDTISTASQQLRGLEPSTGPKTLKEITFSQKQRFTTGFLEFDTVLGGGIVPGSVMLLAGDPGVGKSTLLLQLCMNLSQLGKKVLYISGEESVEQIKMRAQRLMAQPTTINNQQLTKNQKPKNKTDENLLLLSLTN